MDIDYLRHLLISTMTIRIPQQPSSKTSWHHITHQRLLSWLQKMADSYQVEEGEDLLTVLTREGSIINDDTDNNIDDDTSQSLLKLAKLCAQTNLSIASHDFIRSNEEAIYNYGNIAFLSNFGYEWDEFVELPSSKCVATLCSNARRC